MLEYARHGRSIGREGSPLSPILSNIMLDDRDRKSSIRRAAEVTLLGFAFLPTRPAGQDPGRPEGDQAAEFERRNSRTAPTLVSTCIL